VIRRPADAVWDYVVDTANDASWRTGVDESGLQSSEPVGPGTLGYTLAGDQKVEWRVLSVVAGESVLWELTSGPIRGRGGYRLAAAEGGGTEFTLVADVEPSGCLKLLGPISGWIGRSQNQRDVEKLREILESSQDPDHR
jgi:hypothetical protein